MNKSFKISKKITFESIDNNIFILHIENGNYYKLSNSASLIWKEIQKGANSKDIKTYIKAKFGQIDDIEKDIDDTLEKFINLGFIKKN